METQKLKEILSQHGIRFTPQRLELAQYLFSKHQHLTAETVFQEVNLAFPRASRATVFNTLKEFADKGLLRVLELKSGVTLYDSNLEHHHHAIDSKTGQIFDITVDSQLEAKVKSEMIKETSNLDKVDLSSAEIEITLRYRSASKK